MCDFYFFQFFLFFFPLLWHFHSGFWTTDGWKRNWWSLLLSSCNLEPRFHWNPIPHPFSLLLETFIFTCVVVAQKLEHANSTILVSIYLSDPSGQTANRDWAGGLYRGDS
jgi:hypothetical protein